MDEIGPEEIERFVERYLECHLHSPGGSDQPNASSDDLPALSLAITLGVSLASMMRVAARNALPPQSFVRLPVIAQYVLPAEANAIFTAFPDPKHRMRIARQSCMEATSIAAQTKTAAWNIRQNKGEYEALYGKLQGVITACAEATQALDLLVRLEEKGMPIAGAQDSIIPCPMLGRNVTVRLSCSLCVWRGPEPEACFAPTMQLYLDAMKRLGRTLPGGMAGLLEAF